MLRYLTAGESHGPALISVIDGLPAGIKVSLQELNKELKRRQSGYGRGGRMDIESDEAQVLAGLRFGQTLGSPIAVKIDNRDWHNWTTSMAQFDEQSSEPLTKPRPGHADFAGMVRFGHPDARNVLERASARETAARVACGYFAKTLLRELGIDIVSQVIGIGSIHSSRPTNITLSDKEAIDESDVRCLDTETAQLMRNEIDKAAGEKDTLGGIFEVLVFGLPPGIGSYTQWDDRLDARIAMAVKSIQAIKGIEFGDGFSVSQKRGSQVHDELFFDANNGYYRQTNHAGGFEGGMTNGETLVIRAAMKPIATIPQPLKTVDIATHEPAEAIVERSDTCAVPAAAVIAESCVAIELAKSVLEQFGAGNISLIRERFADYRQAASFFNG